jgi:hypothetical protein
MRVWVFRDAVPAAAGEHHGMAYVLGYLFVVLGIPTVIATALTKWLRHRDALRRPVG